VTEKYRSGVEGLVVSLHPSGNGSLGLRTTNHHDTHVTLLPLWRYASHITDLAWRNDEATVTISRRCQGADRVRFTNARAQEYTAPWHVDYQRIDAKRDVAAAELKET
jgi:hypothetical protein